MRTLTRKGSALGGILIALLVLVGCMVAPPPADGQAEEEHGHAAEPVDAQAEVAHEEEPTEAHADIAPSDLVNLNDMTEEQLMTTIPGFTEHMAHEFFHHQPYLSIQQFRRDVGAHIDDEQLAFYEQYVFVPVDINEADGETLKQIPGVDDAVAEALMAARPYASPEAFLEKLTSFVTAGQREAAAIYLKE